MFTSSSATQPINQIKNNRHIHSRKFTHVRTTLSLTQSLWPPPTLRRHTLIPIVAYSQCFVAVAATGSFYRPFTGFLPIFFTVSGIFFGMGNKVVTFTEQQLEDYQVNGLFVASSIWVSQFQKFFFQTFWREVLVVTFDFCFLFMLCSFLW